MRSILQTGNQSSHTVTLENLGSTVLFYTWERRPVQAIQTAPNITFGEVLHELLNNSLSVPRSSNLCYISMIQCSTMCLETTLPTSCPIASRVNLCTVSNPLFNAIMGLCNNVTRVYSYGDEVALGVAILVRVAGKHITNCRAFTVMNGAGSLLAGQCMTATFTFSADVPGVFLESWVLRIAPRLPVHWSLDPLYLKGVAFADDHFR